MQELTLTGATILYDYPNLQQQPSSQGQQIAGTSSGQHPTHHVHPGTTNTGTHHHENTTTGSTGVVQNRANDDHPYLTLSLISENGNHHPSTNHSSNHNINHGHNNHHQHGGGNKSCCGPPTIVHRPMLTLKKPAIEIVMESSNHELYHLLLQIIRMGHYELFIELIDTWRTYYTTNDKSNTTSTSTGIVTFDRMIHAYDTNGHTLTHWAAKRIDDVRIVQYMVQNVMYDTIKSTDQFVWNTEKELVPFLLKPPSSEKDSTTNVSAVMYPTPIHRPTHDNTQMTPLHWACTQENALSIIKVLLDASMNGSSLTTTSITSSSSSSSLSNTVPSILEIRDGTGCTPCLIASQHGRVETVAYLIQRGANIYAVDTARDSAIHWAAYKGSEHVLGLLSYYCSDQQFYTPDAYGQTPIHLASLRGHVSVVRYILHRLIHEPLQQQQQSLSSGNKAMNTSHPSKRMATIRAVKDLLSLKDQNGRTPFDLAVHKNKPAVAAVLKAQVVALQHMANPSWKSYIHQYLTIENIQQLFQLRTWKIWLGLPEVDDLDESPRFAFYYVVGQVICNFIFTFTVFIPMYNITQGVLWDYTIMLMINIVLMVIAAYSLYRCYMTNPGRLDNTFVNLPYWRRLYEQTLDSFASSDEAIAKKASTVQLCHTCHIARPPRSKHDRFSRSCILQFDHHCPFVGTTIGLYNYKWFFLFILTITIYFIMFWIMLLVHYSRKSSTTHRGNFLTLLFGIYLGLHILFSGGMVIYHLQLIYVNLTTNEHINVSRYEYFWDTTSTKSTNSTNNTHNNVVPRRVFYNPWDKGCLRNLYDRLIEPGDHCYLIPDQYDSTNRTVSTTTSQSSTIELHQPLVSRMMETV
jgi:palmitoyltransferase ZDHHC13/17